MTHEKKTLENALEYTVGSLAIIEETESDFPYWTIARGLAQCKPTSHGTTLARLTVISSSGRKATHMFEIAQNYFAVLASVSLLDL